MGGFFQALPLPCLPLLPINGYSAGADGLLTLLGACGLATGPGMGIARTPAPPLVA